MGYVTISIVVYDEKTDSNINKLIKVPEVIAYYIDDLLEELGRYKEDVSVLEEMLHKTELVLDACSSRRRN